MVQGKLCPAVDWKHETEGNSYVLTIKSDEALGSVRLWTATSTTKDFRESKWTSKVIPEKGGVYVGEIAKPDQGHVALYGEMMFQAYGHEYSITTQIRRE